MAEEKVLPASGEPRDAEVIEVEEQHCVLPDGAAHGMCADGDNAEIYDADVLMEAGEQAALLEIDRELAVGVQRLEFFSRQVEGPGLGTLRGIGVQSRQRQIRGIRQILQEEVLQVGKFLRA